MKKILLYLYIFISSSSFAHEFYFGFAEVEYNEMTQKLEATLVVSTHDMEKALREELEITSELSALDLTSAESPLIGQYISAHFLLQGSDYSSFYLIGFESFPNGITHFYLESEPFKLSPETHCKFDLLMNYFPAQQNKLTFYFRDQQHTLTFLPTSPSQTLKLESIGL